MKNLREQIAKIMQEYSDADYLHSEENGRKPNLNLKVDAILKAVREATPESKKHILIESNLEDIGWNAYRTAFLGILEDMKDFKSRAEWKRVEEEFGIVHRLGINGDPADIKSSMMNVEALLASAYAEGLEAGAVEADDVKHYNSTNNDVAKSIRALKETEHGKE